MEEEEGEEMEQEEEVQSKEEVVVEEEDQQQCVPGSSQDFGLKILGETLQDLTPKDIRLQESR